MLPPLMMLMMPLFVMVASGVLKALLPISPLRSRVIPESITTESPELILKLDTVHVEVEASQEPKNGAAAHVVPSDNVLVAAKAS